MNLRTLSITVAALVILCAIAWFAQRPTAPATTDPRVGQSVLAADVAAQAARVKLADQGKAVELVRQANGAWTVPSYYDFPADFAKLSRFISDLTEAKIRRLVTARADRLGRLEFKDTTLALQDASGKELWQIALGKNADGGGRYVRYGTEEKGYLANLSLWLDSEPKNWADALLLNLKADDLARIELGFADASAAPVIVNRAKKEDAWAPASPTVAPEGKRLKAATITSLLSNLADLRFTDTTATDDEKAVAARAHSRTLKLTTFDGRTWTVILARKPEEKKPKTTAPEAKPAEPAAPATPDAGKPQEPEMETIPAGPVFVSITSSDEKAPINALMKKRAFQVAEWTYTALPATPADLWEDAPADPSPKESKDSPSAKGRK
ncbi:MAG TPA: DUF4340 domain-containing protein [Lacunisphaera sp.]|nr:DUF4340 domain-containing protein [Lacunisphaera sp.]